MRVSMTSMMMAVAGLRVDGVGDDKLKRGSAFFGQRCRHLQ